MKKIAAILTASVLLLSQALAVMAEPSPSPSPTADTQTSEPAEEQKQTFPEPRAKAALLYDLKGGRVVYQSHADERMYPASLTKIMTALLALEKGNLTDVLTTTDTALADITYLHSRIDLKSGEQMTLENMLIALLVSSANDAANVIAEYISGDIPSFVALMNQRAAELGMSNTHFANPHGFHDDNHYTTAADLAVLTREALKNTKFCEIVKTKTYKLPATNISSERMISSTNHLISRYRNTYHYYPYATGVKTGSTEEAGSCLVSTAEKNGISLMAVVLGCENADQKENAYSFVDSKAMFEYIFNNYKSVEIALSSDVVSDSKVYEAKDSTRVALSPSKDIVMLLPSDYTAEEITKDIKLAEEINAPIEKGVMLGTASYAFRGETIATVDLLAANEVKRDNLLHFLHSFGRIVLSPFVLIPLIVIAAFLLFNAVNRSKCRKARRRKMKSQQTQRRTNYPSQQRRNTQTRSSYRTPQYSTRTGAQYNRRPTGAGSSRTNSRSTQRPRSASRPPRNPDPWDKYR